MKDFTQLSQQECSQAYKIMLKNSMKKIESASAVASTGDFGTALSIQIVGLEEAIKAIFVYLDSLGFRFRQVKGMKALFKNHELRYFFSVIFIIADMFFQDFIVVLEKFMNYIITKYRKQFNGDEKQFMEDIKADENFKKLFIKIILPRIVTRMTQLLSEIEFYKQFDRLRQDGLYVDYHDTLKVPSDISEEFYEKITKKVLKVTSLINKFIREYEKNKADYDRMIKDLVFFMKEYEGYEFFATILTNIKSEKSTALEYLELKVSVGKSNLLNNKDNIEETIMNLKN